MKLNFAQVLAVTLSWGVFASNAYAAPDLANGKQIDQQKCYACHAKKSGFSNGDMIYTRSDGKVKSIADLKKMVGLCNTELRLDLFPEDEADVVAFLNQQFYKFKP
jgi:mono/diheme cytochrome c family protein